MQNTIDDERIREHLANERTYLARLRTGIAMMGFGIVIAKLRYLFPEALLAARAAGIVHAPLLGVLFAGIGLLIVMVACWRYAVVQNQIRRRNYKASKTVVIALSAIVMALGLLILWYLL